METYQFADKFSFAPRYFSKRFRDRIARDLFQARMRHSSDEYISLCFGLSATCAIFSLGLLSFSIDWLPLSVVLFVFCFFAAANYPKIAKRRRAREIEVEVPNLLRAVGIELGMGLPFETAVKDSCSDSALGREMAHLLNAMGNGSSAQEAFSSFSSRVDSNFAKRASVQLIETYEKGGSGESLKKLADEQESIVRARLKEYRGKMAVYSLLFIAMSAVFPAMLQAFMIVGSSFLSLGITPSQALLVPALLFPAANLALFMVVKWKTP